MSAELLAGLGLVGTAVNAVSSTVANRKTIRANKELAKYQYEKDLEMWNRNNAYNSPEAQMSRLRSAGLNPNMVYGTGTVTGNTSSQVPKYQAPNVEYQNPQLPVADMLQVYQDLRMKSAQIRNINAQTENTIANTEMAPFKRAILYSDASYREGSLKDRLRLAATQADVSDIRVDQEMKRLDLMHQEQLQRHLDIQAKEKGLTEQDLRIESQKMENFFKAYRNELAEMGISTSDSPWLRALIRNWNSGAIQKFFKENFKINWPAIERQRDDYKRRTSGASSHW